jgi:hypothetical protein
MNKFTQLLPFVQELFDDQAVARKAAGIVTGILKACSPRLSDIARGKAGNEAANYKCIQRFLEVNDPREVLLRTFREDAPFVIGDPTEMPSPQFYLKLALTFLWPFVLSEPMSEFQIKVLDFW